MKRTRPIYLDNNATTPVDPRVVEAMLPYFTDHYGNPSSKRHLYGWEADEAVTMARESVAALLGAEPSEIIFTGGATEALNLAIKGFAEANQKKGRHLVTIATEHKAVLASFKALARRGWTHSIVPVDADGRARLSDIEGAMQPDTVLVAAMWANNEVGTIHDVRAIADVAHAHDAAFLCDATQAVGKVPVSIDGIDLLACSAHKFYGPKGVGALAVNKRDRRFRLVPFVDGGSQESGLRGGTLNVPAIVGMGRAASIAREELDAERVRVAGLRDRLESHLLATGRVRVNAHGVDRLPNTCSATFEGISAADLIDRLEGLAVSTGSACSTGTGKPSHVLQAIGHNDADGAATLRISLGRFTTPEDIDRAASIFTKALSPKPVSA